MLLQLARRIRGYPARASFRASLKRRALQPPPGEAVIAFGAPEAGSVVHGGRVKLTHLTRSFRRDEKQFNILYLVSSALPEHAADLADWALACGAKLVWNQNGVAFPAWAGGSCRSINAPMIELMERASFVIYQSEFCRQSADRWLGPARAPSRVLYNPVDLETFSPAAEPPPRGCLQLLAAGTHNQSFRVLGALEALRLLRGAGCDVRLTIAGALRWPRAESEVRRALEAAGLQSSVRMLPAFSQAEAAALLRESHILLHLKYHDPCPTMVIEALACGVPVVGTDTGGMRELVGGDSGELIAVPQSWTVPAYPSPESIIAAIARIMSRWPDFSHAARLRAKQYFDAADWISAHKEAFASVLNPENIKMELQ